MLNGAQHKPIEIKFTRRHMKKIAKKAAPPAWKK
jgi:hypothetical protein